MKRGAQLSFMGGGLTLNLEGYDDPGSGHFAFSEEELESVSEWDDETDVRWDGWLAKLPSTELTAIRDFLNKWLPASDLVAAQVLADARLRDADAAREVSVVLLEALIAVDTEVLLTGNIKDIVDAALSKAGA